MFARAEQASQTVATDSASFHPLWMSFGTTRVCFVWFRSQFYFTGRTTATCRLADAAARHSVYWSRRRRPEKCGATDRALSAWALPPEARAARIATIVGVGTRGVAAEAAAPEIAHIDNPYGLIEDAARMLRSFRRCPQSMNKL